MDTYKRHRFPPDIIRYAVWLYYRFNLSHRDIEDLLAERGITVSREAIRLWHPKHSLRSWGRLCIKFGVIYTRRIANFLEMEINENKRDEMVYHCTFDYLKQHAEYATQLGGAHRKSWGKTVPAGSRGENTIYRHLA
jgi:hypothetical protein